MIKQPPINELALLSNRNTCAILDQQGTVHWYCPNRFDGKAALSTLIDSEKGGFWAIDLLNSQYKHRFYTDRSSVLQTTFTTPGGNFEVCDFMPMQTPDSGILRKFSTVPTQLVSRLKIAGNYGLEQEEVCLIDDFTAYFKFTRQYLYCSSRIKITAPDSVEFVVEKGQTGWAYLTKSVLKTADFEVQQRLDATLIEWHNLAVHFKYEGLFQLDVINSVRAIQQLACGVTGGVLAAATMALPEVIGGNRNYDYRYVWVRDSALITGGLSVLDVDGKMEFKFLNFLHKAMQQNQEQCIYPLYTIDHKTIKQIEELALSGYQNSLPVLAGNVASGQLQLDAAANVLISCKVIYDKYKEHPHWGTVKRVANYICHNWEKPDNGIWEEGPELHYTSGKVFCARGLEMIAPYNPDREEAVRWLQNAQAIRKFVHKNCMTASGAFANYAGSQQVDVSAALYALWNYTDPDSAEMKVTIAEIEKNHAENHLYRRTLIEFDANKEGFFLAGTCWMAHYYAVAGDHARARTILETVKACQNDLGFFSEEIAADGETMLGNFCQTFVHSSFICAVNGLTCALNGIDTVIR